MSNNPPEKAMTRRPTPAYTGVPPKLALGKARDKPLPPPPPEEDIEDEYTNIDDDEGYMQPSVVSADMSNTQKPRTTDSAAAKVGSDSGELYVNTPHAELSGEQNHYYDTRLSIPDEPPPLPPPALSKQRRPTPAVNEMSNFGVAKSRRKPLPAVPADEHEYSDEPSANYYLQPDESAWTPGNPPSRPTSIASNKSETFDDCAYNDCVSSVATCDDEEYEIVDAGYNLQQQPKPDNDDDDYINPDSSAHHIDNAAGASPPLVGSNSGSPGDDDVTSGSDRGGPSWSRRQVMFGLNTARIKEVKGRLRPSLTKMTDAEETPPATNEPPAEEVDMAKLSVNERKKLFEKTSGNANVPTTKNRDEDLAHYTWFVASYDQQHCKERLDTSTKEGDFLVRLSHNQSHPYILLVQHNDHVYTLPIRKKANRQYALGSEKTGEPEFDNVPDLIKHHRVKPILVVAASESGTKKRSPGGLVVLCS